VQRAARGVLQAQHLLEPGLGDLLAREHQLIDPLRPIEPQPVGQPGALFLVTAREADLVDRRPEVGQQRLIRALAVLRLVGCDRAAVAVREEGPQHLDTHPGLRHQRRRDPLAFLLGEIGKTLMVGRSQHVRRQPGILRVDDSIARKAKQIVEVGGVLEDVVRVLRLELVDCVQLHVRGLDVPLSIARVHSHVVVAGWHLHRRRPR
jgi:hypothetical protein